MPQLRTRGMAAGKYFAIQHHTAADAGPQRDQDGIFTALCRARRNLSQRRTVRIITETAGQVDPFLQGGGQRDSLPAKIVRVQHRTRFGVADARAADSDGTALFHGNPGIVQGLSYGLRHIPDNLLIRTVRPRRGGVFGDNVKVLIHHPHRDIGPAKVDSDPVNSRQ